MNQQLPSCIIRVCFFFTRNIISNPNKQFSEVCCFCLARNANICCCFVFFYSMTLVIQIKTPVWPTFTVFFSGFVFATIDSSAKGVTFPAVSVCIFVSLCFFLYLQEVQEIYGKNVRVDEISGFFFYLGWIKEGMWLLSRGLKLRWAEGHCVSCPLIEGHRRHVSVDKEVN